LFWSRPGDIASTNKVHWWLATDEPAKESVLSAEEIAEIELKEKKQREKEKLEQAVKQRETEEATENNGRQLIVTQMFVIFEIMITYLLSVII